MMDELPQKFLKPVFLIGILNKYPNVCQHAKHQPTLTVNKLKKAQTVPCPTFLF